MYINVKAEAEKRGIPYKVNDFVKVSEKTSAEELVKKYTKQLESEGYTNIKVKKLYNFDVIDLS